jgi:hypothetical protein
VPKNLCKGRAQRANLRKSWPGGAKNEEVVATEVPLVFPFFAACRRVGRILPPEVQTRASKWD